MADCVCQVGEGTLSMSFVGELNDRMKGFYRSKYTINGEERYGAVTQFEVCNTLARIVGCRYIRLDYYDYLYDLNVTSNTTAKQLFFVITGSLIACYVLPKDLKGITL